MEQQKEYDLTSIKQQIPSILDDFTKYYIFYNKNPEYDEYQRLYYNIKDNMDGLESQVKKTSQSIDQETEKLNIILKNINGKINLEKARNKQLRKRLGLAVNESNGAGEMVRDYTSVYDSGYTRNWSLAIGIVGLITYSTSLYSGANIQKAVIDTKNIATLAQVAIVNQVISNDATQELEKARNANLVAKDAYAKLYNSKTTDQNILKQARATYTKTQQDLVKAKNALTDERNKIKI